MNKNYRKKIIQKNNKENGFIERFKNATYKFSLCHDLHNS